MRKLWSTIKRLLSSVRYAEQRVRRGWDDEMIWALDDYLIPMLIEVLPAFKDDIGMPVSPDIAPMDGWNYLDDEEARKAWCSIIDTMIEGFKADLVDNNADDAAKAEEAWRLFVKYRHALWT